VSERVKLSLKELVGLLDRDIDRNKWPSVHRDAHRCQEKSSIVGTAEASERTLPVDFLDTIVLRPRLTGGDWFSIDVTVEKANELLRLSLTRLTHQSTGETTVRTLEYSIRPTQGPFGLRTPNHRVRT